jgi:hypothetical protein
MAVERAKDEPGPSMPESGGKRQRALLADTKALVLAANDHLPLPKELA